MSERWSFRGIKRTDEQIQAHEDDMNLLRAIAAGEVVTSPKLRWDLRRLAREERVLAGFGTGSRATLLPRGQRLLAG